MVEDYGIQRTVVTRFVAEVFLEGSPQSLGGWGGARPIEIIDATVRSVEKYSSDE